MADLVLVGRVAGAFGVRGELRLTSFTAEPESLIGYRDLMGVDGGVALTVLSGRPVKGGVVVRCAQVATREAAEALRGLELYVPRAAFPEPDEDEFYVTDLIGLSVEGPDGAPLGVVRTVRDFGAGDLLEVQPAAGPSWWLPFTREAVPQVRLAERRIVATPPDATE
jgi:16S rRNA processing protein RimM